MHDFQIITPVFAECVASVSEWPDGVTVWYECFADGPIVNCRSLDYQPVTGQIVWWSTIVLPTGARAAHVAAARKWKVAG